MTHRGVVDRLLGCRARCRLRAATTACCQFDPLGLRRLGLRRSSAAARRRRGWSCRRPAAARSRRAAWRLLAAQGVTTLDLAAGLLPARRWPRRAGGGLPPPARLIARRRGAAPRALGAGSASRRRRAGWSTLYGPTETTVASPARPARRRSAGRRRGADRPADGRRARVHLLDRDLRPVPLGVPGELSSAAPASPAATWAGRS